MPWKWGWALSPQVLYCILSLYQFTKWGKKQCPCKPTHRNACMVRAKCVQHPLRWGSCAEDKAVLPHRSGCKGPGPHRSPSHQNSKQPNGHGLESQADCGYNTASQTCPGPSLPQHPDNNVVTKSAVRHKSNGQALRHGRARARAHSSFNVRQFLGPRPAQRTFESSLCAVQLRVRMHILRVSILVRRSTSSETMLTDTKFCFSNCPFPLTELFAMLTGTQYSGP